MAVRSMTAYATTSVETVAGTLTIELKSVNSRFLDLQFRMNDEFRIYEPFFRETIMQNVKRGKVECRLSFARDVRNPSMLTLNGGLLKELTRLQHDIGQHIPQARVLSVNELLRWPGMIEEVAPDQETLERQVKQALHATVDAFTAEREREGEALTKTLLERVQAMQQIVGRIEPLIPGIIKQFQQKAVERMQEALGIALEGASPVTLTQQEAAERIRQEVTLYGMRIDVAEELARMSIHLDETKAILEKGGLVGKRMDFMLQELNREANTLGSKAAVKELSDASMDLKLLIEQIREQVQNLE